MRPAIRDVEEPNVLDRFDPRLAPFLVEGELEPGGRFVLSDDIWDLGGYGKPSPLARAPRVSFAGFGLLAPYLKWYALERCLLAGRQPSQVVGLLSAARRATVIVASLGVRSFDELAAPAVFRDVWDGLLDESPAGAQRPRRTVWRQLVLAPFWRATRAEFGVPTSLPKPAVHERASIAVIRRDVDKATPGPVIAALANRLALHRDNREMLPPVDHLRLCVLMLQIALGRRIEELLAARRGTGADGPLVRYAATDGTEALGFRFAANKGGGRDDVVYISPEWVDLVVYATTQLLRYGDGVRHTAPAEARDLLILVSRRSETSGRRFLRSPAVRGMRVKPDEARPLRYSAFGYWLNGASTPESGVMTRWGITASGRAGDPIYRFRTHSTRHARASALAADRNVRPLTAARDLNERSTNVVSIYQHDLESQNADLRLRAGAGQLIGLGAAWVAQGQGSGHERGTPVLSDEDERFRRLLAAQPELLEFNRVPAGYCTRPQGPAACPEFLACVDATDEGCRWFATDPSDASCLIELDSRARGRRSEASAGEEAGRVVLAGKLAVLAERAERRRDEAVERAPAEAIARLREYVARAEDATS